MARVTQGSTSANVQIRLSGVTDIPHLNVNNIINDSTKEEEVKDKIRAYINELKTYISDIKSLYPTEVSDKDKINNIYLDRHLYLYIYPVSYTHLDVYKRQSHTNDNNHHVLIILMLPLLYHMICNY